MHKAKLTLISHHLCPYVQRAAIALLENDVPFERLENSLGAGPWFANNQFTLVDAAFAPAFRYFDAFEDLTGLEFFAGTPKVARWRKALLEHPPVKAAVTEDYPERLLQFFANRSSVVGRIAQTTIAAQRIAA